MTSYTPPTITNIIADLPRKPDSPTYKTRPISAITRIVVHYDAVPIPPPTKQDPTSTYNPIHRYIDQAKYHIARNWNDGPAGPIVKGFGLMYHYRVSADGQIYQTQPENAILWHARAANPISLAICCDLGPNQTPSDAQLVALFTLLNYLCYHRPDFPASRKDVYGHGELKQQGNRTNCPGDILSFVQSYRTNATNTAA
ncbi:MAG: peptidoglycan recognition family protein [Chloroflexia bacterium]